MSPPLRTDLREPKSPISRWQWLLLVVATIGLAHEVVEVLAMRSAIAEMKSRILDLQGVHDQQRILGPTSNPTQMIALNAIRTELMTPWERVLDAITDNAGAQVSLRSVRPVTASAQAEISGVATNRREFLSYIKRLRADSRLAEAFPLGDKPGHGNEMENDKEIVFHARISWKEAP